MLSVRSTPRSTLRAAWRSDCSSSVDRFGVEQKGGIEIRLPLSQEELASWVGASREAVSKAFQLLRTLGIVETGRRRVTVLDLDALGRHARWGVPPEVQPR